MRFHSHPFSWYIEDIDLSAALPLVGYGFTATVRCHRCGRVRKPIYFFASLVLRLSIRGACDASYQEKAAMLTRQAVEDISTSLI
ncbi:hypothetical protein [Nocardia brasiliensis]|uniref:hypothetical protein n=1 Tax=Nocardia brasiliensis TaxID=37326 RepID=UPI003D92374A